MALVPGDIVVVRHEGLEKIKRIEQIDGVKLFIVGDNQAASTDSRHFGWIDRSAVVGKVIWPLLRPQTVVSR
jgi:type IV secretory pathway protease TraF